MSSQLPIRVEENLQSCVVIVFEPFVRSECDIHDLVQLLVSLSQIHWHVFRIVQGLQAAGRLTSSPPHSCGGEDVNLLDFGDSTGQRKSLDKTVAYRCIFCGTLSLFCDDPPVSVV